MKTLTDTEIERSLSNVKATLAVEGLIMSKKSIDFGRKYLSGKITSNEVIEHFTLYIQSKSRG